MNIKRIFISILFLFTALTVLADSGIYICGHFRRNRTETVQKLKDSGYTFGILFNVHVEENGDLTTDGETICKDGVYVFDKTSPNYVDDVNALIMGKTSIRRIEHCIGGWTNYAYKNITNLIKKEGTGENSILYKNFKALKEAIPLVEAINNDIEHEYEPETQSQFHIMLYDLGFKTTIAPYTNKEYWKTFVKKVNDARPGAVVRNYLQCYGGGGGNNPKDWNIADLPIYGSRDIEAASYTHQEIVSTMTAWKNNAGIVGGFYWNYNTDRNLKAEAAPINEVFGGGEVAYHDRIVAMIYPAKNYSAPQTNLTMGTYTSAQIAEKGFSLTNLLGAKLEKGIKISLYTEDNQTGELSTISESTSDITSIIGSKEIKSLTVEAFFADNFDGKDFLIKNQKSNLYLKPLHSLEKTCPIQQRAVDNTDFSVWTFHLLENGLYKIVNKGSGLTMQVRSSTISAINEGAAIEQKEYDGSENQHFIVIFDDAEQVYKLKALNSLKYIGLPTGKENTVNAATVQHNSYDNESTSWLFVPYSAQSIEEGGSALQIKVYPQIVEDFIYIETQVPANISVEITDLKGGCVMQSNTVADRIDMSSFVPGSYFITLRADGQTKTFKLMKK